MKTDNVHQRPEIFSSDSNSAPVDSDFTGPEKDGYSLGVHQSPVAIARCVWVKSSDCPSLSKEDSIQPPTAIASQHSGNGVDKKCR